MSTNPSEYEQAISYITFLTTQLRELSSDHTHFSNKQRDVYGKVWKKYKQGITKKTSLEKTKTHIREMSELIATSYQQNIKATDITIQRKVFDAWSFATGVPWFENGVTMIKGKNGEILFLELEIEF